MNGPFQVHTYCDRSYDSYQTRADHIEKIIRQCYTTYVDGLSKKEQANYKGLNKPKILDVREGYSHADINIHMDFPNHGSVPWGFVNVAVRRFGDTQWNDVFEKNLTYKGIDFVISETDLSSVENAEIIFAKVFPLILTRRPSSGIYHCPPILIPNDCPLISIITPTYNRKKMLDIAFHNILSTDYPIDKIEWVIIEDNEKSEDMASEKIINFKINTKDVTIKYIPIQGRMTIGEKRNLGVENATHDIILFMDDDDHYPSTSFRRRVAWLQKSMRAGSIGSNCAVCTTIALYDLKRGVSAVNVPPFNIPFTQRISEATLTFTKKFWEERKFVHVSVAEGDTWLTGREDECVEMPPQQIIVAFSHGENSSQRRIPHVDAQVSCFWGFPKEYLVFIHKLAGVEIME